MTREEFIKTYDLAPMVPLKLVFKLTNRKHSSIYELNRRQVIQIKKIGSRSFLDVDTTYRLACQPSEAA